MTTISDLYESHLEVKDGVWVAECPNYPCEGKLLAPSGGTVWLRYDFEAVSGNDGIAATCQECGEQGRVIVPSNRYPCAICTNSVKPAEGYVCNDCGIPLCGGNACSGAHESDCKLR